MVAFSGALYRIPNEILLVHFSVLEAIKNENSMNIGCSDLVENVLVFLGVLKPFEFWVRREASTGNEGNSCAKNIITMEIQIKLVFSFPTSK